MSYEKAKALINKGYSRPTLYSVELPQNKVSRYESDYIKMFVKNVNIPGASHETVTALGQVGLGIREDIPSAVLFGQRPVTAEIIDNRDMDMYKLFRGMFDDSAATGGNPGPGEMRTQRMNYYHDNKYLFEMNINKLEYPSKLERVTEMMDNIDYYHKSMIYTFHNTYVTSISPLELASDRFDSYMTFRVAFNYETYHYGKNKKNNERFVLS